MKALYRTFTLGEWECLAVTDGMLGFPAENLFFNAPPEELDAALRGTGITDGRICLPFNPLVLRRGRETLLVDAGFGPGVSPSLGRLPESLRAAGIAPKDVTTVLLSHAHADHAAGALTCDGEPAFPNARYLLNAEEAAFWCTARAAELAGKRAAPARRVAEALMNRAEPIRPGDEPLPGVTLIPSTGHTPNNMAVRVESSGGVLLYVADSIAHPLHLEHPDWMLEPDLDRLAACDSRRALIERAIAEDAIVYAYHFPLPGTFRIRRQEDAYSAEATA